MGRAKCPHLRSEAEQLPIICGVRQSSRWGGVSSGRRSRFRVREWASVPEAWVGRSVLTSDLKLSNFRSFAECVSHRGGAVCPQAGEAGSESGNGQVYLKHG